MEDLITDFLARIAQMPAWWAYGMLLLAAYMENVCPPVPGDVCIVFAGYLASAGTLNLIPVFVLGTLSGVLGFMTVYHIGRVMGHRLVDSRRFRWIDRSALATVECWVARWGVGVIVINRFLASVRSVVALSVGMGNMRSDRVLLFCSLAALSWTVLLASAGYLMGENWERVWDLMLNYSRVVLVVIGVGLGVVVWRRMRSGKKSKA